MMLLYLAISRPLVAALNMFIHIEEKKESILNALFFFLKIYIKHMVNSSAPQWDELLNTKHFFHPLNDLTWEQELLR